MVALNLTDFLRLPTPSISGLSNAGPNTVKRVPFGFTSTARLVRSGRLSATGDLASALRTDSKRKELLAIEEATRPISAQFNSTVNFFSSVLPLQTISPSLGISPVIEMAVNPQSISWQQGKRIVKKDHQEGSTFFHFTDRNDQNQDILTLQFTGTTGNINTKASFIDVLATGANQKLKIWHDLYQLSREGMLLNKSNTGVNIPSGIRNEFYVFYQSPLMQVPLTLIGFFAGPLQFTETAASPFMREYSFQFTVLSTSPSLDEMPRRLSTALLVDNTVGQISDAIAAIPQPP